MIFKPKQTSRDRGQETELAAESYLNKQGLTTLQKNYNCRFGEIDLIMRDNDHLVFVEVRGRKSSTFGSAASTVTASKQKKIILSAQSFIAEKNISANQDIRFDVVGVELGGKPLSFDWIQNAFYGA